MTNIAEVTQVVRYQCSDGRLFSSPQDAEFHANHLAALVAANKALNSGATLAEALSIAQFTGRIPEVFQRVTAKTKLIISHWQCRDTSGYCVSRIEPGFTIWAYGDAGPWSGSYGNTCTIVDVERYALHTEKVLAQTTTADSTEDSPS